MVRVQISSELRVYIRNNDFSGTVHTTFIGNSALFHFDLVLAKHARIYVLKVKNCYALQY
jgi:hypothetical protein